MPGRILTLQRQVRELGRLRAGLTETGTTKEGKEYQRPTSSKTWILTAANRDYLDAAQQLWGGDVHEWAPVGGGPKAWRLITGTALIDAILPPGDPLSQYNEMWSRGGCQRRCDGEQEMLSGNGCLCRAQFGEDYHEQPQGKVCDIHTRLNVFLPDLPDIGVWRVETKGFWPANHIAGYVDMIKGQVGPQVLVPVRLRIEPRTKIKAGKTSQYIEIVVELRSQATFAQILEAPQVLAIGGGGADNRVIESAPARAAIGAAPEPEQPVRGTPAQWRDRFAQATTRDELRSMWTRAGQDGALDDETRAAYQSRALQIAPPAGPLDPAPDKATVPVTNWLSKIKAVTTVEDLRALWEQMGQAKVSDIAIKQAWWAQKAAIDAKTKGQPATVVAAQAAVDAGGGPAEVLGAAMDAEVEPDRVGMWNAILRLGSDLGWNLPEAKRQYRLANGVDVEDADGWQLQIYRDALKTGLVPA